jgi:activator of HSP90 ATPase
MDKKLRTKDIRQNIFFSASPHDVYEMLMDSKKHSAFTQSKATISRKVGGKISVWDGWAGGKNTKLVKDKEIVQTWRADDWPEGHYSIATFKLARKGKGTQLTFMQKGVPSDKYRDISDGWMEYYWEPMKEYLKTE